jgi:hypothetical protein
MQKSLSFIRLLRIINLLTISFSSSALRWSGSLGILLKMVVNYRSTKPKMVPLVLLRKWRSSSKDLIPEKSNLIVIRDIYLMILDILRVLRS